MNSETYTPPVPEKPRPGLLSRILNISFVLLVIGFLAAIIIPAIGRDRGPAYRVSDASNLRQIGQASMIYASDNKDLFPQVDNIHAFASALAKGGGLNDATIWVTSLERRRSVYDSLSTVLAPDRQTIEPAFAVVRPSFAAVVQGLNTNHPPTMPLAWTRGLQPDGTWSKDSPYGGEGGHIVFLSGLVQFYRKLTLTDTPLLDRDGKPTIDIHAAIPPNAVIANN